MLSRKVKARKRLCALRAQQIEQSIRAKFSPALAFRYLRSQARVPLADFRRGHTAEILNLKQWSDLDLAFLFVRVGAALDAIQRLLER